MLIRLDPELQKVVEDAKKSNPNPPHLTELPLEMLRAGYVIQGQTQAIQNLDCYNVSPLEIPAPWGSINARKYLARKHETDTPALIYFHGGGFTIGNLDSHDSLCRQISITADICVISVDYRLAPEHKFPSAVEDAITATDWILANAEGLGLSPDRIAIGGDSAGGNLSAVTCNLLLQINSKTPDFQLLIYPATRLLNTNSASRKNLAEGVTLDRKMIDYFNETYLGGVDVEINDERHSPALSKSVSQTVPAHIVTAEFDPLKDEGREYYEMLRDSGVTASYQCYEGLMHNFVMQTAVVSSAKRAVDDMSNVLRQHLYRG